MISSKTLSAWYFGLALVLLVGAGFRFYNLDKKIFWMDEAATALCVAGYSRAEMRGELSRKELWAPIELSKFQHLNPGRGAFDSVRAMASDDPQHPPLFYALLRIWVGIFGDSVSRLRAFPALVSLLIFPATWWLCRELFFDESHLYQITSIALALMALSPFHVIYAQEARQYSMLTVLSLASSAFLLRAMRVGGFRTWASYALCTAIGFYTHTLFLLLWLAHGAYVLIMGWYERDGKQRRIVTFSFATVAIALLFSPWACLIFQGQSEAQGNTAWAAKASSWSYLVKTWILIFSNLYFDPNQTQRWSTEPGVWAIAGVRAVRCVVFALVLFGLGVVWRRAPRRSAYFILLLAVVPFAAFALPDIFLGGVRSTIARFMIPSFLGVQLAVAYLIATKLAVPSTRRRWAGVLTLLFIAGAVSIVMSSQAKVWWNKTSSYDLPLLSNTLNRQTNPILVARPTNNVLALSRLLDSQNRLYFTDAASEETFDLQRFRALHRGSTIFFYNPSSSLRRSLDEQGATLKKVGADINLWRLQKP